MLSRDYSGIRAIGKFALNKFGSPSSTSTRAAAGFELSAAFEDHGGSGGGEVARGIEPLKFQIEPAFGMPQLHALPAGRGHGFDDGGLGVITGCAGR